MVEFSERAGHIVAIDPVVDAQVLTGVQMMERQAACAALGQCRQRRMELLTAPLLAMSASAISEGDW